MGEGISLAYGASICVYGNIKAILTAVKCDGFGTYAKFFGSK
jgi:hypothetical protein